MSEHLKSEREDLETRLESIAYELEKKFLTGSTFCALLSMVVVISGFKSFISLHKLGFPIIIVAWSIHALFAYKRKLEFNHKYRFDLARLEFLKSKSTKVP